MVIIARERMDLLMVQALKAARSGDMTKADRYAGLARGIGMRYNVRLRPEHRQLICRSCGALLIPSKTSTVRIRHGRRILHCIRCGDIRRVPLKILNKKANLVKNPSPEDETSINDDQ
jgi:RNase P subunit RPR2